jgi:hypothetical protein
MDHNTWARGEAETSMVATGMTQDGVGWFRSGLPVKMVRVLDSGFILKLIR